MWTEKLGFMLKKPEVYFLNFIWLEGEYISQITKKFGF